MSRLRWALEIAGFCGAPIVIALAAGGLVFGQLPDGWTWLGMGIIAASGAATVWLNLGAPPHGRRDNGPCRNTSKSTPTTHSRAC